jgi:arylsulfatase A-like enzyme
LAEFHTPSAGLRPRWPAGARRTFLLLIVAVVIAPVTWAIFAFWRTPAPVKPGAQRFPLIDAAVPDATIEAAVQRWKWTEYRDYGTVQIGRVERPARLLTGRRQWTRAIEVPAGGAHYEAFVGAIDTPVTVRIVRSGTAPAETHAMAGAWTRAAADLDPRDGARQSLALDVEVPTGGVAAWGSEIVTGARQPDGRPDVVLISLDTVRRDQVTPYAPSLQTTPVLAAFAQEATRFDQAISTSSWTIASHATLFTGHFPADSLGYESRVEPRDQTLPEIFAAAGYRTFGVSGGPYTDPRWGFHQGFDEFVVSGDRENARDLTSRAIDWTEQAGGAPAFLFLNYFNAHEPLELSEGVRRAAGVTEDVPSALWFDLDAGRRPLTPPLRARVSSAYRAELTEIDSQLGRLFDTLRRGGRWKRTLVVVWGDHGQLLGERGFLGHAYTLDEELIRVPLLIKAAEGRALAPSVYEGAIQNDDLFALTQALAGLPTTEGAAILKAIDARARVRPLAFSKIHHDPLPALTSQRRWRSATQWAVRDEHTKVVLDLEGRSVAYDLSGPEERRIQALSPESPLLAALHRFQSWSERPSTRTVGPLSPEQIERLGAVGYLR